MPTSDGSRPLTHADVTLLPWSEVSSLPGVRGDVVSSCNDPDMVRWTTVPHPYTPEHADEFLGAPGEGVERWAYVVDGRYAGNIELRPDGVLGYCTAPWARGRGLTTRAVRRVTSYALARGVRRLEIHVAEGNAASRRVAEKAGYTLSGMLDEPVRLRGYEDPMCRYVLTAADACGPNSTSIAPYG